MIKSIEQAQRIQEQRVKAGKRGWAKAVRRYLLWEHKDHYKIVKYGLPHIKPE